MSQESLKELLREETNAKIMDKIENETEEKKKVKHWKEKNKDIIVEIRPEYLQQLNRKQCNVILKMREFMLPVKATWKKCCCMDMQCRFCKNEVENQENILHECPTIQK